jgi:hypothetical protein
LNSIEASICPGRARSIDVEIAVQMSMALHWFAAASPPMPGWAAKLEPLVRHRPELRRGQSVDRLLARQAEQPTRPKNWLAARSRRRR